MPKSIYPSVDEMTNLKTRDRKRKSKTLKSDSEKRLEALDKIRKMIELIDKQELEWRKLNSEKDDSVSRIGNNFYDSLRTSLISIRTTLT